MGMDIHVYIEQKVFGEWKYCGLYDVYRRINENGREVCVVEPATVYSGRDYDLFSMLTDTCRGRFEPVVPINGKPDDMCDEIMSMTDDEYYGYNWITLSELEAVADMLYKLRKVSREDKERWRTFRHFYSIVDNMAYLSGNHVADTKNTRIVYWFDC